jgi:hypothetical protein
MAVSFDQMVDQARDLGGIMPPVRVERYHQVGLTVLDDLAEAFQVGLAGSRDRTR